MVRMAWQAPIIFAVFLVLPACADIKPSSDEDPHAGPAMNYHVINKRLSTSGHFINDGLDQLAKGGLRVVIDLRESPPSNQKQQLADRDIEWVSVPIVWSDPRIEDFDDFSDAMSKHIDDDVLVQCAANYRASAMTYLYRVLVANESEAVALQDLHAVWTPNKTWSNYINLVKSNARNPED